MLLNNNPSLMRELIDETDFMIRVMDQDHKVIYMNKKMQDVYGHTMGGTCYELFGIKEKCEYCVTEEAKETGKRGMKHAQICGRFYNVISSPVNAQDGTNYSIELLHDITEQKKTEDQLMMHYEKLKSDVEFAKHIQNRTLPLDGKYWGTFEINSVYHPSEELSGDIFDIININNNEYLLYIADVSGHGVTSSLLTIFLRQVVRGRTGNGASNIYESNKINLKEILDLIQKNYDELRADQEQYLTILLFLYDRDKKEAAFLNAGHNCMPILIKNTGEIREIEVSGLPISSLADKLPREIATVSVETGDRIILYTDGIKEALNEAKEQFETEKILKIIQENLSLNGKDLTQKVVAAAEAFAGAPVQDDMAIILAKLI